MFFAAVIAVSAMAFSSCSSRESQPREVRIDQEFADMYMKESGGVTGADGTISILLDDGSSLFMTGDCFAGTVEDGKISYDTPMLRNSLIHISKDGKNLGSIFGGTPENPETLCIPAEADTSRFVYWYWPGHGFQLGNTLFLYMTKFYQAEDGQWGFRFDGTDLVRLDMENYDVISQHEVYDGSAEIHWGHSVLKDGGKYYVYGTRSGIYYDPAQLFVSEAAFSEDSEAPLSVRYYDGQGWNPDPASAVPCNGPAVSVSEQFSVFKYKDTYVLLTQSRDQTGEIWSFTSDSPAGPWKNGKLLYVTHEQEDPELFTYNAMAHPQFINDRNELLINYNINSYNLQRPYDEVWTYRPVFLRVPMEMILPGK